MTWFWIFFCYSFLGYLLEKLFATAVHSPQKVRKCCLLLPLCPVYGIAMLTVLYLPQDMKEPWWRLALYGAAVVTGVEFVVHLLYDKLLGVMFWDYSDTKMDIGGRICVPFTLAWGGLVVAAVSWVQPLLARMISQIPSALTYGALLLLVTDIFFSALVLRRTGDVEMMSLPRLLRALQTE